MKKALATLMAATMCFSLAVLPGFAASFDQNSTEAIGTTFSFDYKNDPTYTVTIPDAVTMDKDGLLDLTDAGMAIAARIYERHRLLTEWLTALGVSPEVAAEDACRIEHDISEATFARLQAHIAPKEEP